MKYLLFLLLLLPFTLIASMSDSQALKLIRTKFGVNAGIGSVRIGLDTNWTRLITIKTPFCQNEITTIGSGSNTWEAAIDGINVSIGGPVKNTINITADYPNMGGVNWVEAYVDTVYWMDRTVTQVDDIPEDPTKRHALVTINNIDTTQLSFGVHSVCLVSSDNFTTTVKRTPILFTVDQKTLNGSNIIAMGKQQVADASTERISWAKP